MKYHRITSKGDYQIRRGHKYVKVKSSSIDPTKMKRWKEMQVKKKAKKEEKE